MRRARLAAVGLLVLAGLAGTVHAGGWYDNCPVFVDQSDGTAPWTTGTPESQGLDPAKLLAGVDAVKGDRDIRAVLVIRNGVLVYEGYFHGAGIATALPLHSASKAHLALGCCMAVDEGKLASLDVPVAEVIPRFFSKYAANDLRRTITVRDLLGHTTALNWTTRQEDKGIDAASWVQAVLDQKLVTRRGRTVRPGDIFKYSTGNYHVASAVLQAAVGEKAETYVNRRILAPLGAETEHWATDPEGFSTGGFRVNMTAREMAAFGLMMLDGGRNRAGQQIVPAWCVAECLRDGGFDYGLGWWIGEIADQNQRRWQVIYAWGWGGQVIYLAPGLGLVVVMTADTALDVWEEEPDHEALVRAIICATQQDNNDGDDRHHRRRRNRR